MAGYENDDFADLEELKVLQLEGVDNKGRQIARIVGKFLPARVIDGDRLQAYVLCKLHQELQDGPIVILYFHTCVQSGDNSPGILTLRRIYESLPQPLKLRLEAVYIVHPGIRSRLLLATLGRFFLSEGFYSKVVYIHRLEFLCDFVKDGQVEVPEFVWEHDQELESRPLMDYGLDVDPLQYNNMDALGPPHSRLSFRFAKIVLGCTDGLPVFHMMYHVMKLTVQRRPILTSLPLDMDFTNPWDRHHHE